MDQSPSSQFCSLAYFAADVGGVSEGSVRPQDSEPYGGILLPRLCGIPNDRCRETKALSAYAHCTAVRVHSPTAKAVVLCPATPTHVEQERVTEAVVSVLRKVFADDDANAHRIEAMLRNTIRTAFTTEAPTLFTCLELLRNTEYRNKVVARLTDSHLKDFWREEFGKAGGMQRVSMSKGLTHRLDRFESSEFVKRMMSQEKSTISFEDIIDSGKILICNFSTDMGEDTSTLFGTTVLAKLKIAAERRSSQLEAKRKPFYVYVDEFQNFATTPFVKMLSASRKYKLFLTIAEQSTAQQEELRLTEAILANVSTIVCFGLGSTADEQLLIGRFEPWLKQGNLLNQPAYNFYMRVKAEEPMEPVSGETIVLSTDQASEDKASAVIAASRKNYAVECQDPEFLDTLSLTPVNVM